MTARPQLAPEERASLLYREAVYQALRDLQLTGEATTVERELARRFVFDDAAGVGSFRWCCEAAGLDPDAVRKELTDRGIR